MNADELSRHATNTDSASEVLDLNAGLDEAIEVGTYREMSNQLGHVLNLHAGLEAALASERRKPTALQPEDAVASLGVNTSGSAQQAALEGPGLASLPSLALAASSSAARLWPLGVQRRRTSRGRAHSLGTAMRASEWLPLLSAFAGVLVALAAIPATEYRTLVLIAASGLVLLALLLVCRPRLQANAAAFRIVTPQPEQGIDGGGAVVVSGTTPALRSDTLWVFEEGLVGGQRVWLFGGEALVDGIHWSFDYEPRATRAERTRRTLSIVRVDRSRRRYLQTVRPDSNGQLVVYDPPPDGCETLGQISLFLTAQP